MGHGDFPDPGFRRPHAETDKTVITEIRPKFFLARFSNRVLPCGSPKHRIFVGLELMQRNFTYNSYWYWFSPSQKANPYGVVRAIR
jgi:hypothetical protein